jgi:hypothetical protein
MVLDSADAVTPASDGTGCFDAVPPAVIDGLAGTPGRCLVLVPRSDCRRARVEAGIRQVYRRGFAAGNLTFPSTLVALIDAGGTPLCAAGLRTAADGFFSEAYLDAPIERLLADRVGRPVARNAVFEVTTLAGNSAESVPPFIRSLAALGQEAGFRWSFFTATARLRGLLSQLGLRLIELAAADPRRVPDANSWGSYYRHCPKVCAVNGDWVDGAIAARRGSAAHA